MFAIFSLLRRGRKGAAEWVPGSRLRSTHRRSQPGNGAPAVLCPTQLVCGPGEPGIGVRKRCCSCCAGLARSAAGKGVPQLPFLLGHHFEVRVEVLMGSWWTSSCLVCSSGE